MLFDPLSATQRTHPTQHVTLAHKVLARMPPTGDKSVNQCARFDDLDPSLHLLHCASADALVLMPAHINALAHARSHSDAIDICRTDGLFPLCMTHRFGAAWAGLPVSSGRCAFAPHVLP